MIKRVKNSVVRTAEVRVWRADGHAEPPFHLHASLTVGGEELHAPLTDLLSKEDLTRLESVLRAVEGSLLKRAGIEAEDEVREAEPEEK